MKTLVIATHNRGKLREFEEFFDGLVDELKCAADFDLPEPEETEASFEGNAILKAKAAMQATGLPCLADDSGLVVDALDGDPGIYSARWAGPEKDFSKAMRTIHDRLTIIDGTQTARFVAVLALVLPDGTIETFEGTVEGTLSWPPSGTNGFGYDPMFVPQGHNITFGQMAPVDKQKMSHRANAVAKFVDYLKK